MFITSLVFYFCLSAFNLLPLLSPFPSVLSSNRQLPALPHLACISSSPFPAFVLLNPPLRSSIPLTSCSSYSPLFLLFLFLLISPVFSSTCIPNSICLYPLLTPLFPFLFIFLPSTCVPHRVISRFVAAASRSDRLRRIVQSHATLHYHHIMASQATSLAANKDLTNGRFITTVRPGNYKHR